MVCGKSLDTATLKRSVYWKIESVFFRLIHFFFGYIFIELNSPSTFENWWKTQKMLAVNVSYYCILRWIKCIRGSCRRWVWPPGVGWTLETWPIVIPSLFTNHSPNQFEGITYCSADWFYMGKLELNRVWKTWYMKVSESSIEVSSCLPYLRCGLCLHLQKNHWFQNKRSLSKTLNNVLPKQIFIAIPLNFLSNYFPSRIQTKYLDILLIFWLKKFITNF
jgi:hypothetical protein